MAEKRLEPCPLCGREFLRVKSHIYYAHEGGAKPAWSKGLTKDTDPRLRATSEKRKGVKTRARVYTHSQEVRGRLSVALRGNRNAKHRGRRAEYKGIMMRSSWERAAAEYLDSSGVTWVYEEREFVLSENSSYRPDFFIYEEGLFSHLVEVKGFWRPENRAKFELFKKLYPEIRVQVWDKDRMLALGIKLA